MRTNERNKGTSAKRTIKNVGTTKKAKAVAKPPVEEVRSSKTVAKKVTDDKPKEVVANIIDISNINLQEALGGAEIKVLHGVAKKSVDSYPVNTVLLNLGLIKKVKVRYTEDDWQSVKESDLKFEKSVENDLEIWGTTVSLESKSTDKFHFAVSYEVNGVTYWDNNLGQNHNF